MARKKVEYKIPYVKEAERIPNLPIGSVPHQIPLYEMRKLNWGQKYEWRVNERFDANLKFIKMYYGGKILWENTETGARYWMNQSGLAAVLKSKSIIYGTVLGTWIFRKHGTTYSIFPYMEKKGG
jgi:hypothetical protein